MATETGTVDTLLWAIGSAKERLEAAFSANQLHEGDGDTEGPYIALMRYKDTLGALTDG